MIYKKIFGFIFLLIVLSSKAYLMGKKDIVPHSEDKTILPEDTKENNLITVKEDIGKTDMDAKEENSIRKTDEKENTHPEKDDSFSSIHKSGLTVGFGTKWFFETFDKNGKTSISVFYDKDSLIEKKTYTYKNGKKHSAEIIFPDKFIRIKYDLNENEIEKGVYTPDKKELIEKTVKIYKNNLLVQISVENDETVKTSFFTYGKGGLKQTQEDFIDGKKTAFIEYKKNKKTIHLFDSGKEIGVFVEDI